MSEKSSYHLRGERGVRNAIKYGGENIGEFTGREPNARVAEAMAYAAKPLVEMALRDMQNEPNQFLVTEKGDLTAAPGTVTESGHSVSYNQMKQMVNQGFDQANAVQENYYHQVDAAQKALEEAQEKI